MDGFFGYNQVKVFPEEQEKTTFTTPWGTFMYAKMSFGLMNAEQLSNVPWIFIYRSERKICGGVNGRHYYILQVG